MSKRTRGLALLMILLLLTSSFAFAADPVVTTKTNNFAIPTADKTYMDTLVTSLREKPEFKLSPKAGIAEFDNDSGLLLKYTAADGVVFNTVAFDNATSSSKKLAVKVFVKELQASPVSKQTQQNLFSQMSDTNEDLNAILLPLVFDETKADIFSALGILKPFMPYIQIFIGMLTIGLSFVLVISTVFDLAYIGLPMLRGESKEGGKDNSRPFGVSYDAVSVVKLVESSLEDTKGGYKNAYLIYFKRRSTTMIVLGVCLFYLVMGGLGSFLNAILQLGSGVNL